LEPLERRILLAVVAWDGGPSGTGTDWHDPVNWDGDSLPGAADDVQIGTEFAAVTIASASDASINSLTSEAAIGISDGTFSIAGASAINNAVTFSNGTLVAGGALTVTGPVTWTGGTITGSGQTTAQGGLEIGGEVYLIGHTLTNTALATQTASGEVRMQNGVFSNSAGATFDIQGDGDFKRWYSTGDVFNNAGTLRKSAGTETAMFDRVGFNNTGTVEIQSGRLDLDNSVAFDGPNILTSQPLGTLALDGDLLGATQNADLFDPQGTLRLAGTAAAGTPRLLEAMSQDAGAVPAGFVRNFAYGTLKLDGGYAQLVDDSDNASGADAEAFYVNTLIVPTGSTLDLNGLHTYARVAQVDGTVVGGTVEMLPDGGPMELNRSVPGRISVVDEVDEWTFFGRAGRAVSLFLHTGGDSPQAPLEPALENGEVQILDSADNVLGSASNVTSGEIAQLRGVELPADGTYRIRVSAPAAQSNSRGYYVLSASSATVDEAPISLNERYLGQIETATSVDRWTFSALTNQQIQFDLLGTSNSLISFRLSGPNGWIGFEDLAGDSGLITLPESGQHVLEAYTTGTHGGSYAFRIQETVSTDLTLGTTYEGAFAGSAQAQLFRVNVPEQTHMLILLDDSSEKNRNELYARHGAPPTRSQYDARYDALASADHEILIHLAYAGDWYVLVYSEATVEPGDYSLLVQAGDILLGSATPDHHGDGADALLTVSGAGFDDTTTVELVAPDSTAYAGDLAGIITPTRAEATFPAGSVPPGVYSVRVTKAGADPAVWPDAFEMVEAGEAVLEANLILLSFLGYHGMATLYVEYANEGDGPCTRLC